MSNIDSNIIDPGKSPPLPPDSIVPNIDPDEDHVGSDDVIDPSDDIRPIEPDPEEGGGRGPGDIERA